MMKLDLLPCPRKICEQDGLWAVTAETYIVLAPGAGRLMRTAAFQLKAEVAERTGLDLMVTCGQARQGDIRLEKTEGEAQGYTLTISDEGVTIQGHDEAGVLHGAQTLRQIIRQCGAMWPCLTIEDAPAFPNRGFYHDQTRGRIGTMEWLKNLVDKMCLYKLNQLQLYVEHTYLYRDIPELWTVAGTPLTPEDILTLDDYCAERGVELVPSLSSFGHLLELLRLPRFADLCELEDAEKYPSNFPNRMSHHTINPEDERSFPLITSMIDEFLPLFRSDKFNICADETFDLGKGKNAGKDVRTLYMGFLKKLCNHVVSRGKTPMFWGDIVLQHPAALKELPEGAVCLNWNYASNVGEENTRTFAEAGAVQYVCPGVSGWNRCLPSLVTAYGNICQMAKHGRKYGAIGLLNTDWGDYGHVNDPRFSIPGMIVGACASWGDVPEMQEMWASLSRLVYGDKSGKVVGIVSELSECVAYSWWSIASYPDWVKGDLPHRKETTMGPLDPERVANCNEKLLENLKRLDECACTVTDEGRQMISRWRLAAEGIWLWNRVGRAIEDEKKDEELAHQVENWIRRYEKMWREVSRESELHRIQELAAWYAATLRTQGK